MRLERHLENKHLELLHLLFVIYTEDLCST